MWYHWELFPLEKKCVFVFSHQSYLLNLWNADRINLLVKKKVYIYIYKLFTRVKLSVNFKYNIVCTIEIYVDWIDKLFKIFSYTRSLSTKIYFILVMLLKWFSRVYFIHKRILNSNRHIFEQVYHTTCGMLVVN